MFESTRGNLSPLPSYSKGELEESEESLDTPANDADEDAQLSTHQIDETPAQIKQRLVDWIEFENLAEDAPSDVLQALGMLVVDEYLMDEQSRAPWKDEAQKALDFTTQTAQPKQYPWQDASNIIWPLITSAALHFNAIAYPALVPNRQVVKGVIWGSDKGTAATEDNKPGGKPKINPETAMPIWLIQPGEKALRSQRVGEHMSWQLMEEMDYWEEQTDAALGQTAIIGGFVRVTTRDAAEDKSASEVVSLMDYVWNMNAKSFRAAPRHTEIQLFYPSEIETFERQDIWCPHIYASGDVANGPQAGTDQDVKPPQDARDSQAGHTFLKQTRRYDLDGDGYAEPLVVTVHQRSNTVVRIQANWVEDGLKFDEKTGELVKIKPNEIATLYPFLPNPKGGSYPCGFGHYLKPLNEGINTTLNQMFDAGHLQIAGGGFIAGGVSIPAGRNNFSIGEYKPINTKAGMGVRDAIFPMPWPGPSQVLFNLLGLLIGAGKEIGSIQDIATDTASLSNTAPTTMVLLVEQGMRVYTAIYKRIYRAMKSELSKLFELNRQYITEDTGYQKGDEWVTVTADDYRLGGGVKPWADPTMVTDSQRLTRAALIVDRAEKNPMVDRLAAEKYLFEAANIPRVEDYLPDQAPPMPPTAEQIKAQIETQKLQLEGKRLTFEMAEAQSKLGLTRAQELQAYTQAMLNFAKAKGAMSDQQVQFMEQQLTSMRLQIEAVNATVRAAQVDATVHATKLGHRADMVGHALRHRENMTGHAVDHHANMADLAQRGRELASEDPTAGRPDDSGGAGSTYPLPQPQGIGDDGAGLPGVAPPPDNQGGPAVPGPTPGIPAA